MFIFKFGAHTVMHYVDKAGIWLNLTAIGRIETSYISASIRVPYSLMQKHIYKLASCQINFIFNHTKTPRLNFNNPKSCK